MRSRLVCYAAALLCVLVAAPGQIASASTPTTGSNGSTALKTKPEVKAPPMASQVIPGVPLRTEVRDSASAAVYYNDASQFFSDNGEGVFVWAGDQVWGPTDIPDGPIVNPYTPISNVLSGAGTPQNPWRIVTTVGLGSTGLQLIRSVRYVNGDLYTRQDFEVRNYNTRTYTVSIFHAGDLRTAGDDAGYGYFDMNTGAIGGYNQTRTFYQLFLPITPGSHYKEGLWNSIWGAIGNTSGPGLGFDNSYHPDTYEDNGAGLQWVFTLPGGGRVKAADLHTFTTSVGCEVNFSDVYPDDYYYDAVIYLACAGALSGYSDNTFRPGSSTTRGQLSKIVVGAEGWTLDTTGGPHFIDVPTTSPFYSYIETAYNRGVISGYADSTFRPGSNATRGQISKIVYNAINAP